MIRLAIHIQAAFLAITTNISATAAPPNILFIYTDDQAGWALGASGNPQAFTPNMDLLASQGARFTNAFVTTPVCSPSRAGLMTSRYSSELDIPDFIPSLGHRLYKGGEGLDPAYITFPEILQKGGYTTGLVGKWHLGEEDHFHPTRTGFDEFAGFRGGGSTPINPTLEIHGKTTDFTGRTPDILTDHAIDFLDRHASETFFLAVHYRAPHGAWLPVAKDDWAPYEDLDPVLPHPDYPGLNTQDLKRRMREYLASTRSVDRNLGRLFNTLKRLDLEQNTVVAFTSDHGYNMGHNGIWHKGNGRWAIKTFPPAPPNNDPKYRPNLYDQSLRVPLIVRWPGVTTPGSVIEQNVTNLDWYPTFIDIAQLQAPSFVTVRGRSMIPLLRGEAPEDWPSDLYTEYSMTHYRRSDLRSYRTPEWKLVRDFLNPGRDELYNLASDPEETTNLIDSTDIATREAAAALDHRLLSTMRAIGDPLAEQGPR
ncbi:MAG: sulfatase family protein [Planctomycetota bacterium]